MKIDTMKMMGIAMAMGVVAVVGCTPKSGTMGSVEQPASPPSSHEVDERIEASFKKTYVYARYLKNDSVDAEAKDGVVTLTGTVSQESHKELAEDTAESLPGVIRVHNRLETAAEYAAAGADIWIDHKVNLTLMFHSNVDAEKTHVNVKEGFVVLTGEASSIAQKDLTTEYAKDIEGVTAVRNDMTVAATPVPEKRTPGERMDDASITAQVRTALLTHRSTSAVRTLVQTRNGEVTLTGIAKNEAQKSLVTKLVNDIQGVTSVDNQMTIEVAMKQ